MDLPADLALRELADADAAAVIGLVGAAYDEHPGCVLDLPGVDADLPRLATALGEAGGRGWVVVDGDDRVVACVGLAPVPGTTGVELKRLYVAADQRRRGLGAHLVRLVEHHAVADHEADEVVLWSDTRFVDAHRLYERLGYERGPRTRDLHDPSDTTEYRYRRRVSGSS